MTFALQYDSSMVKPLAAEYKRDDPDASDEAMEAAGKRIAEGNFSIDNLEIIYDWKSPRRRALLRLNSSERIERALKNALRAQDVGQAVCALTQLKGIGVKMASAILTAMDPDRYTVLDFRALQALGCEDHEEIEFYVDYLAYCKEKAAELGVSLRDFDRANWQWSKNRAKKAAK